MQLRQVEKGIVVFLFLIVIIAVPLLTYGSEKEEISTIEFRTLAEEPVYTGEALWDGSYFKAWETYMLDHIYSRNQWFQAYHGLQLYGLGKTVINSTVVTDDVLLNYNFHDARTFDYTEDAQEQAKKLAGINDFVKSYGGVFLFVGLPEQRSMLREAYPWYLENGDRELLEIERAFQTALEEEGVPFLNMRQTFLAQEDYAQFYAKTDHHYNFKGALFTCHAIADRLEEMGMSIPFAFPAQEDLITLDNPFEGSRGRRISFLSDVKDHLQVYTPTIPLERWDVSAPVPPVIIELPPDDESPVAYSSYMGGDIAETLLSTGRPELKNMLIWGDSFTNAAEALLYTGFHEMRSLDLRFYRIMGLHEYIDTYRPDVVICMLNDTNYLVREGNLDIH